MRGEQSNLEALLGPLYAAVGNQEGWTPFLELLCHHTRSSAGTVAVFDAGGGGSLPAYVGAGADVAQLYEGSYAAENPWRSAGGLPGAVRLSDELTPWRELRETDFYRGFLRPLDLAHGVGVVGTATGGRTPSLTVLRDHRTGVYQGRELDLLERLAPHWVNASSLWSRLDALERPVPDFRAALDYLATGVWLVDGDGALLQANASGTQSLVDGLVRVRNGRLMARELADRSALTAALRRAAKAPDAPQANLVLRDALGRPAAALSLHRLSGPGTGSRVRVLVFLQPIWAVRPGLADVLPEALGLTPAEARLAEALYRCRGNLGAASGALGVSPSAARTRMKTVLHKVGVADQAELMGVLQALEGTAGLHPRRLR